MFSLVIHTFNSSAGAGREKNQERIKEIKEDGSNFVVAL